MENEIKGKITVHCNEFYFGKYGGSYDVYCFSNGSNEMFYLVINPNYETMVLNRIELENFIKENQLEKKGVSIEKKSYSSVNTLKNAMIRHLKSISEKCFEWK